MPLFTILSSKDLPTPPKPLLLVQITAKGAAGTVTDTVFLSTTDVTYSGNVYESRLTQQNVDAIQAMSVQGFDVPPSLTLEIADPDRLVWLNHARPYPWKGSDLKLTFVGYDVETSTFSTDARFWNFICGTPQITRTGLTVEATNLLNMSRIKLPGVIIEFTCPWTFPSNNIEQTAGLTDRSSQFWNCGYSAQVGGIGTGSFTKCNKTREDCTARGMFNPPSFGRFGGFTWAAPIQFSGRKFTTGAQTKGYNQPNQSIYGQPVPMVYGTQWVNAIVLQPAAEPNSLRWEALICLAQDGHIDIDANGVIVNGVTVPDPSTTPVDNIFRWQWSQQGGRDGVCLQDAIFNLPPYTDPHGSMAVIECVVPVELASPGSIPTTRVLANAPALPLPTTPNPADALGVWPLVGTANNVFHVLDVLTWANWTYSKIDIQSFIDASVICGFGAHRLDNPITNGGGAVTISGSTVTCNPGLADPFVQSMVGKTIYIGGTWFTRGTPYAVVSYIDGTNITISGSPPSGANTYTINYIPYTANDGSTRYHHRYRSSFVLDQRQTAAEILTGMRNAADLMLAPNPNTGLLQVFVKQTMAEQQGSPVAGSNYNAPVSSMLADRTVMNGYAAYRFDETNIQEDTFHVTTRQLTDTPNRVTMEFQDEDNHYQHGSISVVDTEAVARAGYQDLPIAFQQIGICNFDQALRTSNTLLSEGLRGNPTDEASGTLYPEFRTTFRAIHLRVGHICLLSWQSLAMVDVKIRILSIKPTLDGQYLDIKSAWISDDWYTDLYQQNPAPFIHNPLNDPPDRPPYPWKPGASNSSTATQLDPIYGRISTFGINQTYINLADGAASCSLNITGTPPINTFSAMRPPIVPSQAQISTSGGNLLSGTYIIRIVATAGREYTAPSRIITAVIPAGVTTGSIIIPHLSWPTGTTGWEVFVGYSELSMGSWLVGAGSTPSTIALTVRREWGQGYGCPDIKFDHFRFLIKKSIHSGILANNVTGVDPVNKRFDISGGNFVPNHFVGRTVSVLAPPIATARVDTLFNGIITANSIVTVETDRPFNALIDVGSVVVIRAQATTFSSTTIGDADFINNLYPAGMTVDAEIGNIVRILAGTGAGQQRTIVSNTSTVLTVDSAWAVNPDSTSIFALEESSWSYTPQTSSTSVSSFQSLVPCGSAIVTNYLGMTLLVKVITEDSDDDWSVEQYAPWRELYIFGQGGGGSVSPAGGLVVQV